MTGNKLATRTCVDLSDLRERLNDLASIVVAVLGLDRVALQVDRFQPHEPGQLVHLRGHCEILLSLS